MQKTFAPKPYFLFINLEMLSPRFNFPLGKYNEAFQCGVGTHKAGHFIPVWFDKTIFFSYELAASA